MISESILSHLSVIKRDGTLCSYNRENIKNAIKKAIEAYEICRTATNCSLSDAEKENETEFFTNKVEEEIEKSFLKREKENSAKKSNEQFVAGYQESPYLLKENQNQNEKFPPAEIFSSGFYIEVEQIQDLVVHVLRSEGKGNIASIYSEYREKRSWERQRKTELLRAVDEITNSTSRESNIKRDNGNIDGDSAMGTMLQYGSALSKNYTDNELLLPEIKNAVKHGDIYIHDKDFYPMGTLTCTQIPLDKLFERGFNTGHGSCRSPQSIGSYAAQTAVIIQANQNDNHGGQAIPLFDFYLAPGVKKTFRKILIKIIEIWCLANEIQNIDTTQLDSKLWGVKDKAEVKKLLFSDNPGKENNPLWKDWNRIWEKTVEETEKQTYQAMESLIANLNTMHSRAGAQVPFSSLNFGMDISEEGRMVSRNLMLAQEAGLGNGETSIFPITIFQVKEGVNYNPDDPNYDLFKLAIRVSAKRLFPNFVFVDAPFNLQYYNPDDPETIIATMGCRTRVIGNVNGKETPVGRGNLSFTTINLPALGIRHGFLYREEHKDVKNTTFDESSFFAELDQMIDLGICQLLERYEVQKSKRVANFPFLMGENLWRGSENLSREDVLAHVIDQGTLSLGFIGLAECLVALTGNHHGETDAAQKLGLKIIGYMRQKMDEATSAYHLNFSLLATPAEGLSGYFTKIDKKRYGVIPGVTDREYYTNSFHVPVYYKIGFEDKIRIEAPYHALTNAGHISYVEVDGDLCQNLDAFEMIVRCMKENGIGYGSINHPVDRDPVCGYTGIIDGDTCPGCGRNLKPAEQFVAVFEIEDIHNTSVSNTERFTEVYNNV